MYHISWYPKHHLYHRSFGSFFGSQFIFQSIFYLVCALLVLNCSTSSHYDLISLVDTRIGSGGFGFGVGGINPGPQVPFGACRLGPDTDNEAVWLDFNHYGGYYYPDPYIRAFSHTHMVGPGVSDWGNIGIMAYRNPLTAFDVKTHNYRSHYTHDDEIAKPGRYQVMLTDHQVMVELTIGGTHAGMHRYTFQNITQDIYSRTIIHGIRSQVSHERSVSQAFPFQGLLIDVCHTTTAPDKNPCHSGSVTVDSDGLSISGWVLNHGPLSGRSQHGPGVYVYFVAEFETPGNISGFGVWVNGKMKPGIAHAETNTSQSLGAYFTFKPPSHQTATYDDELQVLVRVGISFISIDQAKINLLDQLPKNIPFDVILRQAQDMWENTLSVVEVSPSSPVEDQTLFYSALYRTFLAPTTYSEIGGYYRGYDDRVHSLMPSGDQRAYFSDMSLWDVHRSEFPWLLLINSTVHADITKSLLLMTVQGTGDIPTWPLANVYTGCMIGNHGNIVFADSLVKWQTLKQIKTNNLSNSIPPFNVSQAYFAMRRTATETRPHGGRSDLDHYTTLGYVTGDSDEHAASKTLAYAFDDWAIATLAKWLNLTDDVELFSQQSKNYQHLFDKHTQWMCPRWLNGSLDCPSSIEAEEPYPLAKRYVEGNAWQWLWFVPQDPDGLVALFPDRETFVSKLDMFFNKSTLWPTHDLPNPFYWAGNEPDIFAVWLFAYAGRADLTQYWSRWVLNNRYSSDADGIPGNDDFGTLSAWQLFTILGFYPQAGSTTYIIGSPALEKVILHRQEGDIVIIAHNASRDNVYVKNVTLNGVKLTTPFFQHDQIAHGGNLEFWMNSHSSTSLNIGGA